MSYKLLEKLVEVHAPAGEEEKMTEFILNYVKKNSKKWKAKPKVYSGKGFQNCVVLVFGKPKAAVYAHLDSIGFTVKYNKEIVKIGGPRTKNGYKLVGTDSKGVVECTLKIDKKNEKFVYVNKREIDRGTTLTFKPNFRETKTYVQSPYMDNRLGVYNALRLCETIKNGAIVFSCWEEHGGGAVGYLGKFLYEKHKVSKALISDITWVTEGVMHGKGVAVSLRDSGLPRKLYTDEIRSILDTSKVTHQLEVESAGGSDGNELQKSPYPIDWCFVGAPESNVHSPDEKVYKKDIDSMLKAYQVLMD
ncbi:MAG: M20/M25/M40 family metallo-hydrolase, partial [Bacteroidia bacterium]|nr:M20/M25/M40 family metallo-hydrolase [Bacteroidia bacterium]